MTKITDTVRIQSGKLVVDEGDERGVYSLADLVDLGLDGDVLHPGSKVKVKHLDDAPVMCLVSVDRKGQANCVFWTNEDGFGSCKLPSSILEPA